MKQTPEKLRQTDLRQSLANAIAQQRFEGQEPSSEVIIDLEKVILGQLSIHDVIINIGKRAYDIQIRQH